MPNVKISKMPPASPLDGSEIFPIVQIGVNKKTTIDQLHDVFDAVLEADLTVELGSGGTVGGTFTGEFLPKGTTLEQVLRDILIKAVHPTYIAPTVVLTTDDNTFIKESGTIINPTFNYTFNQNDAGTQTTLSLRRSDVGEIAITMPFSDFSYQIGDGSIIYSLLVNYLDGPIKNNNLGAPDAVGQILAGNVISNFITYIGERKIFWGASNSIPNNTNQVRSFATGSMFSDGITDNFTINIPINSAVVWFAYPETIADPLAVQYIELSFSDVKALFTKSTVAVEGASGYTPINYSVYEYTPLEPFQATVNYKVIIPI